jgi:hypothetical protein
MAAVGTDSVRGFALPRVALLRCLSGRGVAGGFRLGGKLPTGGLNGA